MIARSTGAELSPVCAVVGGMVAAEVVKIISGKVRRKFPLPKVTPRPAFRPCRNRWLWRALLVPGGGNTPLAPFGRKRGPGGGRRARGEYDVAHSCIWPCVALCRCCSNPGSCEGERGELDARGNAES